jgi:hypothetical protein
MSSVTPLHHPQDEEAQMVLEVSFPKELERVDYVGRGFTTDRQLHERLHVRGTFAGIVTKALSDFTGERTTVKWRVEMTDVELT